jgi:hypothetical protein
MAFQCSIFWFEAGLAASKGEVKRLIAGGGAKLNDIVIESVAEINRH